MTKSPNRWLVAIMGTVMQIALGTVYAWSFFQQPIMLANRWSNTQVAWAFSLAIFFLGVAAAWGGTNLPKYGPRRMAMTGGVLYGLGYLIAAYALRTQSLSLLYVGYGIVGGVGLGLGYVTPVATAAKWFPDKKGLITGMVVMGFGFGALIMAKILAPMFMAAAGDDLVKVFLAIGVLLIAVTLPAGFCLVNPPLKPASGSHVASVISGENLARHEPDLVRECLFSRQFIVMWLVFFLNITAGIMFIGFQSPLLQDLLKQGLDTDTLSRADVLAGLAASGATLIAVSSVFNGVGRLFWGGMSDRIGRERTFRLILGTQVIVFAALVFVKSPFVFSALVCYILLCYGGGFGAMPSFILDVFGARVMPVVYGCILTAWGCGGIVGPQIVAFLKDHFAAQAAQYTFVVATGLLLTGLVLTALFRNRKFSEKNAEGHMPLKYQNV